MRSDIIRVGTMSPRIVPPDSNTAAADRFEDKLDAQQHVAIANGLQVNASDRTYVVAGQNREVSKRSGRIMETHHLVRATPKLKGKSARREEKKQRRLERERRERVWHLATLNELLALKKENQ